MLTNLRELIKAQFYKSLQHLLYMLTKSEYAWGTHLKRFSELLESPLKEKIVKQSQEEIHHGRILSGSMQALKVYPRVSRQTKYFVLEETIYIFNADETTGYFSPIKGASKRLQTLRFVLQDRSLEEYDITERLAFAQTVESMACAFYSALSWVAPFPLNAAARAIAQDEIGHKNFLFQELQERVGAFRSLLLCFGWLLRFILISPVAFKEFLFSSEA